MGFNLSDFLSFLFGSELQAVVLTIVGATKIFRNFLGKIKGIYAIGATILVAIVIGEVMFLDTMGWLFAGVGGLFAGLESAGLFVLSKFVGKKVVKLDKE